MCVRARAESVYAGWGFVPSFMLDRQETLGMEIRHPANASRNKQFDQVRQACLGAALSLFAVTANLNLGYILAT